MYTGAMNFLGRCNGYKTLTPAFSNVAVEKVVDCLPEARLMMLGYFKEKEHELRLEAGHRFHSDQSVVERIASVATEQEFMAQPMDWVVDALRDCAGADYWYTYEKQWD